MYPSYGIETDEPGVLLLYSWMTDASLLSFVTFSDRVRCALQHLAEVYKDEDVDVFGEFMAANDMPWAEHSPTGDCMFLPDSSQSFSRSPSNPRVTFISRAST